MDPGGGVQQSHDEVQSGHSEFYFFTFKYILTFQAGLTVIEVHFDEEKEDTDPEPLRMEHFYFPLGLWMVGILLSVFCFLIEIIIHQLTKPKTDVPMARLEESGVTQFTPEKEDSNANVENIEDTKI